MRVCVCVCVCVCAQNDPSALFTRMRVHLVDPTPSECPSALLV